MASPDLYYRPEVTFPNPIIMGNRASTGIWMADTTQCITFTSCLFLSKVGLGFGQQGILSVVKLNCADSVLTSMAPLYLNSFHLSKQLQVHKFRHSVKRTPLYHLTHTASLRLSPYLRLTWNGAFTVTNEPVLKYHYSLKRVVYERVYS